MKKITSGPFICFLTSMQLATAQPQNATACYELPAPDLSVDSEITLAAINFGYRELTDKIDIAARSVDLGIKITLDEVIDVLPSSPSLPIIDILPSDLPVFDQRTVAASVLIGAVSRRELFRVPLGEEADSLVVPYEIEPIGEIIPITTRTWEVQAMDSVVSFHRPNGSRIFCSGSLLKDQMIVTARHCLNEAPQNAVIRIYPRYGSNSYYAIECPWSLVADLEPVSAAIDGNEYITDIQLLKIDTSQLRSELASEVDVRALDTNLSDPPDRPKRYAIAFRWPNSENKNSNQECSKRRRGVLPSGEPFCPDYGELALFLPNDGENCNAADLVDDGIEISLQNPELKVWSCPVIRGRKRSYSPGWPHTCTQPKGASGAPLFDADKNNVPVIVGVASVGIITGDPPDNCLAPLAALQKR